MSNKTSIQVSRELQEILSDLGKKGETYEGIIRRLVNGDTKMANPDDMMTEFKKMIRLVKSGICKGSGRVTKADMEYLFGKTE